MLLAGTGTTSNVYRYTAQQWDSDLGMYYLRARYYKPNLGRFWTMDTYQGNKQDPLSLHKYLYCTANPVNMVDPTGMDGEGGVTEQLSVMTVRTVLFAMNVGGALGNARQTIQCSVAAYQAVSDGDPWNASMAALGATIHGGLVAANVLGMRAAISSIGSPPPGLLGASVGGAAVSGMWRVALATPTAKQWVFQEAIPAVGGLLGVFAMSGNGMEAKWQHRDSDGNVKSKGEEESGSFNENPGRLNWNQQLETHAEWKILAQLTGVQPGDTVTIEGEFPPCNPGGRGCYQMMQDYASRNRITIIYKMMGTKNVWTFPEN
jgi:RHS repeat-associated protein